MKILIDSTLKRQIENLSNKNQNSQARYSSSTNIQNFITPDYNSNENLFNKKHIESVNVFPRLVNTTEYKSFQLDCTYKGHRYLNVKLIWYKNDRILKLRSESKRIIHLDYTFHNTKFSILKFANALRRDSGIYRCKALDQNNKKIQKDQQLKILINKSKFICFKRCLTSWISIYYFTRIVR